MPSVTFRVNTQSIDFPLNPFTQGQTVQIQKYDTTYVPGVNPDRKSVSIDRGIGCMYFARNVLPSTYGYQSASFVNLDTEGGTDNDAQVERVVDAILFTQSIWNVKYALLVQDEVRLYIYSSAKDKYTIKDTDGNLITVNSSNSYVQVSVATVNGVTYICVPGKGIYTPHNSGVGIVKKVTLKGLSSGNIQGIFTSMGYLLAWSTTGISWSSSTNPLEFRPTVDETETGAGSGDIQAAKGPIVWCEPTSYGAIIYTTENAVQATFSGNTKFPWNFREIPNANGVPNKQKIAVGTQGEHYILSNNAIQKVYHTGAEYILPQITDFLKNPADGLFISDKGLVSSYGPGGVQYDSKPANLSIVEGRYLCVSYDCEGSNSADWKGTFRGIIVYDMVQQRFGKLNAFHDLVRDLPMASDTSWVLPSSETTKRFSLIGRVYNTSNWYTNRHIMLAVVDPYVIQAKNRDSRLYRTSQGKYKHTLEEFSYDPPSDTGIIVDSVIIFGKFQAVRGMQTQLTDVKIDSIPGYNSDPLTYLANCSVIPHLDGKFNDRVVTLISTTDYYEDLASVEYQSHEWAKSHSVVVQGGFDVTSIELTTHIDGVYR